MKNDDNCVSVSFSVDGGLSRSAYCTPAVYVGVETDIWLHILHDEMKRRNFEPTDYHVVITAVKLK